MNGKRSFLFFIYEWKAAVSLFPLPDHFEPYDVLALLSSTGKV